MDFYLRNMKKVLILIGTVFLLVATKSCVTDNSFENPLNCSENLESNTSYSDVKALYSDQLVQIQEDLIIEGYISSSDRAGNFFSVLHFQDRPNNPTEGFQIEVDLRESHLFFAEGTQIFIKLKGLYLDQSNGVFRIGGTFSAFGTTTVGRLPALQIPEHIFLSCAPLSSIEPSVTTISNLNDDMVNTLVQINDLQFVDEELGNSFADLREETERLLEDCSASELVLLNSGFSDFQPNLLPEGNGALVGVLLKDRTNFVLAVRDLEDINFTNERCADLQVTSTSVFITELADPNNNTGARFVELFNSSNEVLDLNGWVLRRYTNANVEISSTIDLTGLVLAGQSTLVISPNAQEFQEVYGFAPDLGVATNSPADSNGDDNLELVDPFGLVIDVFGVIGEDGSGTNHEFEDGKAVRNMDVFSANATYTFSEWLIFNDTGDAGTTNLPQSAPEDFNPGVRE